MAVSFALESRINKAGEFPIRASISIRQVRVQKQYSMLKWFITRAVRKGYTQQDYTIRYKPKFKVLQKPVIFLTKEELLKVYNYEIPANQTIVKLHRYNGEEYEFKVEEAGALAKTRDLFCFALSSGIPPQVVMKWTGHSDYKAMQPDIDIAEKTKAEAMTVFEKSFMD